MILYTMVPYDLIFQTPENDYKKQKIVDVEGVQLLVQETETNELEILRLLSTNPNDYLTEKYSPGQKVMVDHS